jgi:hypothetical protein
VIQAIVMDGINIVIGLNILMQLLVVLSDTCARIIFYNIYVN